ncbi:TIGR02186 family protein [Devosia riboflavina]
MNRILALVLFVLLSAVPAGAAVRLVSGVSNDTIQITSSFDGERLTFYGTIAPEAGSEQRYVEGPFDVVIVVLGPTQDRVAREKTHNFGIWLNTEQVEFKRFPSYFHVLFKPATARRSPISTCSTRISSCLKPMR